MQILLGKVGLSLWRPQFVNFFCLQLISHDLVAGLDGPFKEQYPTGTEIAGNALQGLDHLCRIHTVA